MKKATARDLKGRKIVAVEWNRFSGFATDPVLILDNGKRVFFVVQETNTGYYGVQIQIVTPEAIQ